MEQLGGFKDGFMSKVGLDGAPEPDGSQPFDEYNPKYMCFRNRYHVSLGMLYIVYFTIGLTALYAVIAFFSMIVGSTDYLKDMYGGNYPLVIILVLILNGVVLGCAFFGLRREKRHYLVPFLVWAAISAFAAALSALMCLGRFGDLGVGALALLILYALFAALDVYFCLVAYRCREYFRQKEKATELGASGQQVQQQTPGSIMQQQAQPFDFQQGGPPMQQQTYQQAY